MFKLLIGIILFFVLMLLFAGALGIRLLRSILGGSKPPHRQPDENIQTYSNPDKDKIFGEREGDYVEYEEIKEDKKKDEVK